MYELIDGNKVFLSDSSPEVSDKSNNTMLYVFGAIVIILVILLILIFKKKQLNVLRY